MRTFNMNSRSAPMVILVIILSVILCLYLMHADYLFAVPYLSTIPESGSAAMERTIAQIRTLYTNEVGSYYKERKALMFHSLEKYESWWTDTTKAKKLRQIANLKLLAITQQTRKHKVNCTPETGSAAVKEANKQILKKLLVPTLQMISLLPTPQKIGVEQLYLDQIGFYEFSFPFASFLDLKLISLTGNCLRKIDTNFIELLTQLDVLDLRFNQLQTIDFSYLALNSLSLLDLSYNPIQKMELMKLDTFHTDTIINMRYNPLNDIDFCYDKSPGEGAMKSPKIFVGTGHSILCTCKIIKLDKIILGNKCIRATTDLQTCPDSNLCEDATPPPPVPKFDENMLKNLMAPLYGDDGHGIKLRKILAADTLQEPFDDGDETVVEEFVQYLPPRYIAALVTCLILAVLLCVAGCCIHRISRTPERVQTKPTGERDELGMSPLVRDDNIPGKSRGARPDGP